MKSNAESIIGTWSFTKPVFEYYHEFKDNATPWSGHKCFAYNLIKNFKPGLVVELGSWKGTSFYSFCQAVKDGALPCKLVAIDTWQGDAHVGVSQNSVFTNFKGILERHYSSVDAHYIRKSFNDAVSEFNNECIDILHIDGFHTYAAVSNDFNTWKGKVKKDGIILFHDIAESKDDFGTVAFWNEIKAQYKTCLQFDHSHGLGILFLDEQAFNRLAPIFDDYKTKCLEYSYQATKAELFEDKPKVRELAEIKVSKFWKLKEQAKSLLGKA